MKAILTLNIGSTTVKFAVFSVENNKITKEYSGLYTLNTQQSKDPHKDAISKLLKYIKKNKIEIIAIGHRFIQGGDKYKKPTPIDDQVISIADKLKYIAPLHQPYNIKGYKILYNYFPSILHIACFDTSFHTTCNKLSQTFAIPKKLINEGLKRYGYHGLSYEYIVTQFDKFLPPKQINGRIIIMHLGGGATMCAIKNKKSVAISVGFSAVDGLVMGTRCGSIDAGVLLYLMKYHKMNYKQLTHLLYKESGLLGVSGISSDMRKLLSSDSPDAKLAVDLFIYRISQWIGTLTSELQGLDGLIFTGGIGENSPYIREQICKKIAWLNVQIDKQKNKQQNIIGAIHHIDSNIPIYVIPTDEEVTIAKHTFELLKK